MLRLSALLLIAAAVLSFAARVDRDQPHRTSVVRRLQLVADLVHSVLLLDHTGVVGAERVADLRDDDPVRVLARPIGWLQLTLLVGPDGTRFQLHCTAAVIAQDKVLTNEHCLDRATGATLVEATLWLDRFDHQSGTSWPVGTQLIEVDAVLDYAILPLLPRADGVTPPVVDLRRTRVALSGESLIVIHHPAGRPLRVARAHCIALADVPTLGLVHSCPIVGGSSGSLVFAARDHAVLGLNHLVHTTGRKEGIAVPMPRLVAKSPLLQAIVAGR